MGSCQVEKVDTAPINWRSDDKYLYIGRPSKWGNPFDVASNGRINAVMMYVGWVRDEFKEGRLKIMELDQKILVCWCVPKLCHGHILKAMLEDDQNLAFLRFTTKEGTTNAQSNERKHS